MNKIKQWIPDSKFWKYALFLLVPILVEGMVISGVSFVDNLMVGHLKNNAIPLTSVLIANELFYMSTFFMIAISGMCDIFLGQYYGAEDQKSFSAISKIKVYLSMFIMIILIIIFVALGKQIIGFWNSKPEIINATYKFLIRFLPSMLFFGASMALAANLRIAHHPQYALYASLIPLICNIILDYLFIYTFHWGYLGAAWATDISRLLELGLLVTFTLILKEQVGFDLIHFWKIDWKLFRLVWTKAFSIAGVAVLGIGLVAQTAVFTRMGDPNVSSALGTGYAVGGIVSTVFPVIGVGVKMIVGNELGRGDLITAEERSKKLFTVVLVITASLSLIACSTALFLPQLVGLTGQTATNARNMILVWGILVWFPIISSYFYGVIESGGYTAAKAIIHNGWTLFIAVPLGFILITYTSLDFIPIFIIVQTSVIVPAITSVFFYSRKKWLRTIVNTEELIEEPEEENMVV